MNGPDVSPAQHRSSLADIVAWTGATTDSAADLSILIESVASLELAGPGALAFLDNPRYVPALSVTRASACFVAAHHAASVPAGTIALVAKEPYRAFAIAVARLYPDAMRPGSMFGTQGVAPGSFVHPEAWLGPGVTVDPGAIIGPRAEVGGGTIIGAHAVVGPGVRIGRDCSIGAQATVVRAVIGDRVILHPGVRIGQDGFGFAMGPGGHLKVPQIGRVVIEDDVEIGSNTTIDRGSNKDTVIGQGTKIDNLVQIGHNVAIGRHCVIVAQTGISGSTVLGDYAVMAGQVGLAGHLTIGAGAQIGAKSGVIDDVPAGERWFGIPAQAARDEFRMRVEMRRLVRSRAKRRGPPDGTPDGT